MNILIRKQNSLFTCDSCGASIETSKCPYCRAFNQSIWEKEEERKAKELEKQSDNKAQVALDFILYGLAVLAFIWCLGSVYLGDFLGSVISFLIGAACVALPIIRTRKRNKGK